MDQEFNYEEEIKPMFEEIDDDDRKEELMAQKFYLYEMLQDDNQEEIDAMLDILTE